MTDIKRRAFLQALLGIPVAAKVAFLNWMPREVSARGYTTAGTGQEWQNTRMRIGLFNGDTEVSGHGYRRVLAQSKGGVVSPLGTTRLRADFPVATSNWGIVDRYEIYDDATGKLVARGLISEENRSYIAANDTAMMDLDIEVLGEGSEQ